MTMFHLDHGMIITRSWHDSYVFSTWVWFLSQFIPENEDVSWFSFVTNNLVVIFTQFSSRRFSILLEIYTVKLARVKRPHTQLTCVTCSLPGKTGKFTCAYAASTSRRIHANYLRPRVNLSKHSGYFTSNFTCGTHANLPATDMQHCLLLHAKIHEIGRSKHPQ